VPADKSGGTKDGERGTTITEVLTVVAITALLGAPLLGLLVATSRIERNQTAGHETRIELDSALLAIETELVNATPVASRPNGTTTADTLGVLVTDEAAVQQILYWTVNSNGLVRIEADPDTLRVISRSTIAPGVVAPGTDPFRYYDASGALLDPAAVGVEHLANCTTLIEISLAVELGDELETATSRRAVRTRPPGGNGC
jgi:type II secretory pathway pseudopilin PulG